MATKEEVKEYYDTFKEHQKQLGINIRHRTILKNLKNAGLKANSNVLEIGCGIGISTKYLSDFVSFIEAIDASETCISKARKINSKNCIIHIGSSSNNEVYRKIKLIKWGFWW